MGDVFAICSLQLGQRCDVSFPLPGHSACSLEQYRAIVAAELIRFTLSTTKQEKNEHFINPNPKKFGDCHKLIFYESNGVIGDS